VYKKVVEATEILIFEKNTINFRNSAIIAISSSDRPIFVFVSATETAFVGLLIGSFVSSIPRHKEFLEGAGLETKYN